MQAGLIGGSPVFAFTIIGSQPQGSTRKEGDVRLGLLLNARVRRTTPKELKSYLDLPKPTFL